MAYPPKWRRNTSSDAAVTLMKEHFFANFITAHSGLHCTRIPLVADIQDGEPLRLRGHLNRQNPQVSDLDGQEALVTFPGRATYVSPHWRTNLDRGSTVDYEEVQVRGQVRVSDDMDYFIDLINDLSAMIEPQYAEVGDYPLWHTSMTPPGYIEDRFPAIQAFEVQVTSVNMISKLHQSFPAEDRRAVADHLERSTKEDARIIAKKIRDTIS